MIRPTRRTLTLAAAAVLALVPLANHVVPAPHAYADSGGGCGRAVATGSPGPINASFYACISGSWGLSLTPDGYVHFPEANPSFWNRCTLTIHLRDDTYNATVATQAFNCLPDARLSNPGAHYGFTDWADIYPGHLYHTYITMSGSYGGNAFAAGPANSPGERIPG